MGVKLKVEQIIIEYERILEDLKILYSDINGCTENNITDDKIDYVHYKTTNIVDRLWYLKSELAKKVKNV